MLVIYVLFKIVSIWFLYNTYLSAFSIQYFHSWIMVIKYKIAVKWLPTYYTNVELKNIFMLFMFFALLQWIVSSIPTNAMYMYKIQFYLNTINNNNKTKLNLYSGILSRNCLS